MEQLPSENGVDPDAYHLFSKKENALFQLEGENSAKDSYCEI
jgi:hypothetical protein